ncbi:MAG: hypothetical protein KIT36_03445 [Alphaproteobacteria bacterium]|nr:hypothetical protein [Alphaproteobacteria bacterium]
MAKGAGHNIWYMWGLAQRAYSAICPSDVIKKTFSPALLLAIAWEETMFNNIHQEGFDHGDWMKRWSSDPAIQAEVRAALESFKHPELPAKQIPGNHAVGFVQCERDTIGNWLLFKPEVAIGLPGFDAAMLPNPRAAKGDAQETRKLQQRTRWWQTIDEVAIATDEIGFQLGWRGLWYLFEMGVARTKASALKIYAGKNPERDKPGKTAGRTAPQIIDGWLRFEAVMAAYERMRPIDMLPPQYGWPIANRLLAGAFWIAKPDGDFVGGFGVPNTEARIWGEMVSRFVKPGLQPIVPPDATDALRDAIIAQAKTTKVA